MLNRRNVLMGLRNIAIAIFGILTPRAHSAGIQPQDTQIVAQWLDEDMREFSFFKRVTIESQIEGACAGICFLDGHDIGSGTYNIFLYSQNIPETVKRLIELEEAQRIPSGLRIGVAKYKDEERTDWTYEPAYPSTLKHFEIMYR
jgi:hypothetical protein